MSDSDSDSPPPLVPDDGEGFHDDLLTRPILRRSRSKSATTSSVVDEDLFLACRAGKLDSVRYMVEVVGLPVNQRDRWDSTPLYYACLAGHKDVVLYLLEQGARCEENTFDGERCFHGALTNEIRNILRKHKAVVRKHDPFSLFMRSCYLPTRSATASLSDSSSSVMQSSLSSSSSSAFQTSSIRATNPFLKYSDIIFVVGNPENEEELRCHRVILAARCEYFKNMLLTRWKDKPKVFLRHARMNATAFKAVLQFLYTERLEIDRTLVTDCALLCRKCGLLELCAALERENEHDSKYHVERLVVEAIDLEQRKHEGDSIPIHQITTPLQHDLGKVSQRALFGKPQDDDDDDYADVIFSVNDRRQFRCHKLFFCGRCEYFATLLMGSFREVSSTQEEDVTQLSLLLSSSTSSEDEIEEVKVEGFSEEAFAMIVDFIYTDKLSYSFPPPSSCSSSSSASFSLSEQERHYNLLLEVMQTANMMILPVLKNQCAMLITQFTTSTNVFELIRYAQLFELPRLEDYCTRFIALNLDTILQEEENKEEDEKQKETEAKEGDETEKQTSTRQLFIDLVKESAFSIKDRQATDSVPIVDDIRAYLAEFYGMSGDSAVENEDEEGEEDEEDRPIEYRQRQLLEHRRKVVALDALLESLGILRWKQSPS